MCIQGRHPVVDCVHTTSWWWTPLTFTPPLPPRRRRHIRLEKLIPVTRLSASLLTSWLFPDKYSRPLDSTPLSSRIMANYQEAVCWKDAARNCICLQTVFRFKHVLWKNERNNNNNKKKNDYLQRHFGSKEPKTAFKESCDCWEMPESWLTCELAYLFILCSSLFCQKLFTRTQMRHAW